MVDGAVGERRKVRARVGGDLAGLTNRYHVYLGNIVYPKYYLIRILGYTPIKRECRTSSDHGIKT